MGEVIQFQIPPERKLALRNRRQELMGKKVTMLMQYEAIDREIEGISRLLGELPEERGVHE